LLIIISNKSFAQKDYVITVKGDTIKGIVFRNNLNSNYLRLKHIDGKIKFHLRDIKEWRNGKMPVTVIPIKNKKRTYWLELRLVIDGKIKLYQDIFHLTGSYYSFINGTYLQLNENNIENVLLKELQKCKVFDKAYANRNIKQNEIESMFHYYNRFCTNL
jgi:subtilase family serine protease